jgi:WD40 repeat protein
VLYDDPAVLSYLISLKFTLNDNDSLGRSPLHYAALLQNVTLANILTDAGADVNQQDADGQTPMDIAQRLNNIEIIHLLTLKNAVRGKSNATSSVKINLAPFGGYDYAAISPKNKFILTSTYHTLRIWDVGSGKILKEYILDNSIESAKFSPDEQFIVAKTADRLILIEVATGKEVRTIFDETIWTPIQKTDEDGMTWDTLVEFPQYSDICFSPTGFLLAYIHGNKIKLVDLKNGALINSCFWNPESGMTTVRFSPDGRIIVSGGQDGTTRLWNPETGEKIQFYNQNESEVVSVCVSPDGQQVLTGSNDSIMRLWDILSRKELCRFHLNNNRIDVSFSSDGKYAQSSAHDLQNGSVKIWDLRSKAELKSLKIYPFVNNGFDNKEASVSPRWRFLFAKSVEAVRLPAQRCKDRKRL